MENFINPFIHKILAAHTSLKELKKLYMKQSSQQEINVEFLQAVKKFEAEINENLEEAQKDFNNQIYNELIVYLNHHYIWVDIGDDPYKIEIQEDPHAYKQEIEGYPKRDTGISESNGFSTPDPSQFQRKDYLLEKIEYLESELLDFCTIDANFYSVRINDKNRLVLSKKESESESNQMKEGN